MYPEGRGVSTLGGAVRVEGKLGETTNEWTANDDRPLRLLVVQFGFWGRVARRGSKKEGRGRRGKKRGREEEEEEQEGGGGEKSTADGRVLKEED